jgi:hypothetical protein
VIECQGEQHFEPIDFAYKGKEWANNLYHSTIERDKIKYELCKKHNISILYYSEYSKLPDTYFNTIYNNEEKLLNVILKF